MHIYALRPFQPKKGHTRGTRVPPLWGFLRNGASQVVLRVSQPDNSFSREGHICVPPSIKLEPLTTGSRKGQN